MSLSSISSNRPLWDRSRQNPDVINIPNGMVSIPRSRCSAEKWLNASTWGCMFAQGYFVR